MGTGITKRIQDDDFPRLLERAVEQYGLPNCYEELVVYLGDNGQGISTRVVLRSTIGAELVSIDKEERQITRIPFNGIYTKRILSIFSQGSNLTGVISISPVYEFRDKRTGENVRLIKTSIHGPIIIFSSKKNENDFSDFVFGNGEHKGIEKRHGLETVLDYEVSPTGILNTKILTYLEKNGIALLRAGGISYREVMENRSNDYGNYDDLFNAITGLKLNSKAPLPLDKLTHFDLSLVKVSIIIPCYNSEMSITAVLDSISKQKTLVPFENLEVVLIDDASTNRLREKIDTNKYPFSIRTIRFEENAGASTARHLGAVYAKGEILVFIDSDILISSNYLNEHVIRNLLIPNAVFISFKQNINSADPVNLNNVPDYSHDLRIHKIVHKNAVGSYAVNADKQIEILESTNYFKSFSGSRIFGVYDLSCMVVGHNFSVRKKTLLEASPFSREFSGWGMEDVFLGLKLIFKGNFIIPVLSTGVFHLDHPPRSGSEEKKQEQYQRNTEKINALLDSKINSTDDEWYEIFR